MSILYLHISSTINCLAKYLMGENYQILTEGYAHPYLTTFVITSVQSGNVFLCEVLLLHESQRILIYLER